MNNFIFQNSTKVYFGRGCVREYLGCLSGKFGKRVMLAYGDNEIKDNGIYDEIKNILEQGGKEIVEFAGISPNPTYGKVLKGAEIARKKGVEFILGVGGDSVMDCCKAITLAAKCKGDPWKEFWERPGIVNFEPLPLGVVVTDAGAGGGCNGGTAITNETLKIKTGRDYPACDPKFALMDPSYTCYVPKRQTVSGGFNTLSHLMEIYFSRPDEENVSDDISEALMRNVIHSLQKLMKNSRNYTARSNLMWDAVMAENRITSLGKRTDFGCHQMAYQLGAYTGCDHEEALAVLQPVYYRHIYQSGLEKFGRFATEVWRIFPEGKSEKTLALAGVEALEKFIEEIGLPSRLREIGVSGTTDFKAVADSCNISTGSYKTMTKEEIFHIYKECL